MNNVVPMQSAVLRRPRDYDPAQLALIRRTVAADTTADEFNMFIKICQGAGLDPFRRQIYCVVYNKDDEKKRKVAFITGIDGLRAVARPPAAASRGVAGLPAGAQAVSRAA